MNAPQKKLNRFLIPIFVIPLFFSCLAHGATCGEPCETPADCDTSCALCIGTCVTCYEVTSQELCLSAGTGGDDTCQWDGTSCKALTDIAEIPSRPLYWLLSLLLVPLIAIAALLFRRKRGSVR